MSTNNLILSALIWPQNFEKKGLLIMNKNRIVILSTNNLILSALIWPQNFKKKEGSFDHEQKSIIKNCARVDFSVYVILSLFFCHVNFALVAGVRFSSTFFCHFYTHTQHIEIVLIWHPLLHFHYTIVGYATLCSI